MVLSGGHGRLNCGGLRVPRPGRVRAGCRHRGVGFDSPGRNQDWAQDEGFAYELWTDDDKTLALHYGAIDSTSAPFIPVTRVLDGAGTLVVEYRVSSIDAHPEQVLEDCRLLFGDD